MSYLCFTLAARVADQLDRYYRKASKSGKLRGGRPIRRILNQNPDRAQPQRMRTNTFTLGVIDREARPGESLDQTIFRLAGGIL